MKDLDLIMLISISSAALSWEIAFSTLADKIKKLFYLDQPYRFSRLVNITSWRKIFGKKTVNYLLPLFLILILLFKIHRLLSELFSCPFCISYQLTWLTFYLYLNMPLLDSLIFAPLALVGVHIINNLNSNFD